MSAAFNNNPKLVRRLLDLGCRKPEVLNARRYDQWTALKVVITVN
jgi:hypothetical protein